jgi:outer membrane protein OmpA-like peptidoglycan-associated protein
MQSRTFLKLMALMLSLVGQAYNQHLDYPVLIRPSIQDSLEVGLRTSREGTKRQGHPHLVNQPDSLKTQGMSDGRDRTKPETDASSASDRQKPPDDPVQPDPDDLRDPAAQHWQAKLRFEHQVKRALVAIHFNWDKSNIGDSDRITLQGIAEFMKAYPRARIWISGYCDDRGTLKYNLALGNRRAEAAQSYLVSLGIDENRLSLVSYGKEAPLCTIPDEACRSKNRRAEFKLTRLDIY